MQASLAAVGGLAGVGDWTRGHGASPLAAGLLMMGLIAFTLIVILPTNKRLLDPALDPGSAGATALLATALDKRVELQFFVALDQRTDPLRRSDLVPRQGQKIRFQFIEIARSFSSGLDRIDVQKTPGLMHQTGGF